MSNNTLTAYAPLTLCDVPEYDPALKIKNAEDDIYELREEIYIDLLHLSHTYRLANTKTNFTYLANQLEEFAMNKSLTSEIILNPIYRQIIGMGKKIIPLIMNRLDNSPSIWVQALMDLTGHNPVPIEEYGKVDKILNHWRKWIEQN